MIRPVSAAFLILWMCASIVYAAPLATSDKQTSATVDYKNRPDPCEPKQKKSPPAKAPTKQSSSRPAKQ
jgi:hypothetical protein